MAFGKTNSIKEVKPIIVAVGQLVEFFDNPLQDVGRVAPVNAFENGIVTVANGSGILLNRGEKPSSGAFCYLYGA